MSAPDLSVIVPVRDGEATLGASLASVLERADRLLEVIVVDDGSTDASAAVAEALGPPVRVLRQAGAGPAAARNAGVAAARGRLVGFLDADDLWLAGTPDPGRALLEGEPGGIAVGLVEVESGGRRATGPLHVYGAALLARSTFAAIGGLDERLVRGEDDVEWYLRARDAGISVVGADEVVLRYVRRPGSLTPDTGAGLLRGLRATIDRRRAQA